MSVNRTNPQAGFVYGKTTGLCRRCGEKVAKGRRTFCSDACVHEWKLRSDPGYLRAQVKKRDKGVCRMCRLDTTEVQQAMSVLRELRDGDTFRSRDPIPGLWDLFRQLEKVVFPGGRKTAWDADHIVAVKDGGGECSLDNIQTLCLWCHKRKTTRKPGFGTIDPAPLELS